MRVRDDGFRNDARPQPHHPNCLRGQVVRSDPIPDVPDDRDTREPAGHAAIESRLERIGMDDVGLQFTETPPQRPDVFQRRGHRLESERARPDAALPDLSGRPGNREHLDRGAHLAQTVDERTLLPEDHMRVHPAAQGSQRVYQRDLAAGQSGHVVDVDDPVGHPESMDISRAAVSSASPRVPSRARASSVAPSSAESTARGLERAATVLSRRRRTAGPRVRGSGCQPAPGSKRNTAISLTRPGPGRPCRRAPRRPPARLGHLDRAGSQASSGRDGPDPDCPARRIRRSNSPLRRAPRRR